MNTLAKSTATNEQFHASGGAYSYDTEQVTSSFALVRALPIPPPAQSRPHVSRHPPTAQWQINLYSEIIIIKKIIL